MKKALLLLLIGLILSGCSKNNTEDIQALKDEIQELRDGLVAIHGDKIVIEDNISELYNKLSENKTETKQLSNEFHKYVRIKEGCEERMEYIERVAIVDRVVYQGDGVYAVSYYPVDGRGEMKNNYTTNKEIIGSVVCK